MKSIINKIIFYLHSQVYVYTLSLLAGFQCRVGYVAGYVAGYRVA